MKVHISITNRVFFCLGIILCLFQTIVFPQTAADTQIKNIATVTFSDGTTNFSNSSNEVVITVAKIAGLTITPDAQMDSAVVPGQTGVVKTFRVTNTGNFTDDVVFGANGSSLRVVGGATITSAVVGSTDILTNPSAVSQSLAQNGFVDVTVTLSINSNATLGSTIQVYLGDSTTGTNFDNVAADNSANEAHTVSTGATNGSREARGDVRMPINAIDLTVSKTHTPATFIAGLTGTYTITASNIGNLSTSGAMTITDTLPTGLSVNGGGVGAVTLSGTNAANWTCNSNAATLQVITCTSSNVISTGGSNVFSFNVNVSNSVASSVTNNVAISGGGEAVFQNGNNTASDVTPTLTQPNFGGCDARMYLSQGPDNSTPTTLQLINTATNPFTYPALGTATLPYNAIGYNAADNYLYGMQIPGGNTLVRVGSDGSTVVLGNVSGLPNGGYVAGEISPAGVYYVKEQTSSTIYAIDLATYTATAIPLSQSINSLDLAWSNGVLYTIVSGGQLIAINPTTGAVTLVGTGNPGLGGFGAMYGAPNGLFGNSNGGTGFYQFDTTNGVATKISDSPGSQTNDGAHCTSSPIVFGTDIAIAKTDGQTNYSAGSNVVYTITVTNNGPFGAQNITVSDPLPSGITTASWTCAATGGGTCAASGTGAINDTTVDLPNGAIATYTLTIVVPVGFTGNLVNTATVTVSPSTTESNLSNNSATDTDGAGQPVLGLLKSCPSPANCTTAPQMPGTDLTYQINFTNTGGQSAANLTIIDRIPDFTDYKIGTATANVGSTGLTFTIEYSSDYDAMNPTFATWTYTPVSGGGGANVGYDRNIKAVRWRVTGGTLSNVSPNNLGDVSFVTKIR